MCVLKLPLSIPQAVSKKGGEVSFPKWASIAAEKKAQVFTDIMCVKNEDTDSHISGLLSERLTDINFFCNALRLP